MTQPRIVPQDFVAADLARGDVTAYRLVTVDQDFRRGPFSSAEGIDVYAASDDQDGVVDGAADGRPVTIAYWVDAPVATLRVLDTNGLSSDTPAALVETFRAAGVPEAEASRLYRGLPSDRVANAGAVLLFVGFLVVVLGPRPRRGTRWFWFWIVGGPLSVGLPIFAVAELLRAEVRGGGHRPPTGGRRPLERAGRFRPGGRAVAGARLGAPHPQRSVTGLVHPRLTGRPPPDFRDAVAPA